MNEDKQLIVYNDDYKPVNVYSSRTKVGGYKTQEYTGKHIELEDTYNDLLDVKVQGKHEQDSKYAVWWNQLISETAYNNIIPTENTVTYDGNIVTLIGNSLNHTYRYSTISDSYGKIPVGHKVFVSIRVVDIFQPSNENIVIKNLWCKCSHNGTTTVLHSPSLGILTKGTWSAVQIVENVSINWLLEFGYTFYNANNTTSVSYSGTDAGISIDSINIIDLTAMFGAGYEPTAEQFRKMYPADYYPYCAGEWRYASGGQYVNFNQLIDDSNYSTTIYQGLTRQVENHILYIKGTTTHNEANIYINTFINKPKSNHKFYIFYSMINPFGSVSYAINNSYIALPKNETVITANGDIQRILIQYAFSTGEVIDSSIYIQMFDLTQMFGEGNEPTTVEEFKALYPNEYYDYVESRYEYTPGYYENSQVVQHIPETAFRTPLPDLPEEVRPTVNPKIRISSTLAPNRFIPTETTIPFTLYGDGTINDEVEPCVLVNGQWKCRVTRRWGNKTVNKVNGYYSGENPYGKIYYISIQGSKKAKLYSNKFSWSNKSVSDQTLFTITDANGSVESKWICMPNEYDTIQKINNYFNDNPFIVYYQFATPQIELYDPIPIRTLPINLLINSDANLKCNIKTIDKLS